MTDQDLDRALADALDVEPQADFLARVRTEVARQPAPSAWPGWWRIAAATTAAVVVVIAAYWPASEEEPAVTGRTVARVEPPATTAPPAQTVARIEPAVRPRRTGQVALRAVPLALPVPLISSEDADVLHQTLAGASAGLFASMADRDAAAPVTVSGIELTPIAVMPLAQMTQLDSGELQ